jgi:hypothetical protein
MKAQKTKIKKWPRGTRWQDKFPVTEEEKRLKQQCYDLKISNIIWG